MRAKDRARFEVDALRDLAGDKAFARGEAYCRNGQVEILSIDRGRVLARVAGTEDYRTELTGRGREIGGACSCPAFDNWGFCKHMVAAALAADAAGGKAETEGAGALARIREHLRAKGADALVETILAFAERDPALFRKLDMEAAAARADDRTLEARLRKAIDAATRTGEYIDYYRARGWARGVNAVLDTLADLASGERAKIVLALADRAIGRIEQAAESIDDSDGHCGALLGRARDVHLAAARVARPDPIRLARDLFAREMEDDYGAFAGAAELYADVLGDDGLAEFRRLALEAWEGLPPRSADRRGRQEAAYNGDRLRYILDFFAKRAGDVETRIALRAEDLSSPWSYLQLAEFCLSQGREEEALRRAEEGLWVFEDDRPDERLVLFAVKLLSKAGRKEDAEAHLRRAFEKAPDLQLYAHLRELGGAAAREWAVGVLKSRLSGGTRTACLNPADLLVRILTRERAFDAAWAAARAYGAPIAARQALAQASEATHPREAVDVYSERVDRLADQGGNPAYEEAARLVARMAALRSAAEQAAYVAALKERFGRKRNFMKLLG